MSTYLLDTILAAEFAICASQQGDGAFWQTHDFFFENQTTLNAGTLQERFLDFSGANGIDVSKIRACMDAKDAEQVIGKDVDLAERLNVRGTPAIYINGKRTQIRTEEDLVGAIQGADRELADSKAKTDVDRRR